MISRGSESTKENVAKEQGGFRSGRGCVDHIFVLKQVVEKDRERKKNLYVVFMALKDLGKKYDKVWRVI